MIEFVDEHFAWVDPFDENDMTFNEFEAYVDKCLEEDGEEPSHHELVDVSEDLFEHDF